MSTSDVAQGSTETLPDRSHTPGPWVSFYKHKYNEWHVGVPVSSGSMKLALFPDGCPTENPESDCHLIAAAPDLLACLKEMGDWIAGGLQASELAWPDARCLQHTEEMAARARAAVDKAEGRS